MCSLCVCATKRINTREPEDVKGKKVRTQHSTLTPITLKKKPEWNQTEVKVKKKKKKGEQESGIGNAKKGTGTGTEIGDGNRGRKSGTGTGMRREMESAVRCDL